MQINNVIDMKDKGKVLNIAIIIVVIFVAYNIYKNQSAAIERLKGVKMVELKKNEILNKISRLEKDISVYKKTLSKKDVFSIIDTITSIAKGSGVAVVSIKPAPEERFASYTKYPFVLSLYIDNYHDLGRFVSQLENNPGIYFVDKAQIVLSKTGPETDSKSVQGHKLTVNLVVSSIIFQD
ncbi:MAG: type 4a pilus biogenesis protein PilO [Candidatus Omnitrophota bacterium]